MKRLIEMAVIATSGMTLFSRMISLVSKEKFLETKLLNQLIFSGNKKGYKHHAAGFVLHYAVGTFFASVYYKLWKKNLLSPGNSTSILMGIFNGIMGISGWHICFSFHSNPPDIHFRKYYIQLLLAHGVFGYLNGLMFRKGRSGFP